MNRSQTYPWTPWIIWLAIVPAGAILCLLAALLLAQRADVQFDRKDWWWLVLAAPLAAGLSAYGLVRRRRGLARFASADLVDLLTPSVSPKRQAFKAGAAVLGLVGVAVALVGPRWGVDYEQRKAVGVDVMVVLDVSRSMAAEDVKPDRLEAAKRQIERLVARRINRVGLMAFAGEASLKCPLTLDYGFAKSVLDSLEVGAVARPGTDIGNALRQAADRFTDREKNDSKAILLITDGEDHGGYADETADELFKDRRIRTFTVGIGDNTRGARVPADNEAGRGYLQFEGQEVWSRMNPDTLRGIAQKGGGKYAPIEQFSDIMDEIDRLEKKQLSTVQDRRYRPRYQWFLAAAMVLLAVEALVGERRSREPAGYRRLWERKQV